MEYRTRDDLFWWRHIMPFYFFANLWGHLLPDSWPMLPLSLPRLWSSISWTRRRPATISNEIAVNVKLAKEFIHHRVRDKRLKNCWPTLLRNLPILNYSEEPTVQVTCLTDFWNPNEDELRTLENVLRYFSWWRWKLTSGRSHRRVVPFEIWYYSRYIR